MASLTFMELLAKGGITVVILLFFSVISIAVMIERAWTFRRFNAEFLHIVKILRSWGDCVGGGDESHF
mgnify:CR=1 FL=1